MKNGLSDELIVNGGWDVWRCAFPGQFCYLYDEDQGLNFFAEGDAEDLVALHLSNRLYVAYPLTSPATLPGRICGLGVLAL